ncbi:MAG: hypothetical protein RL660_1053 [Bacteroidota bacterium]|jgi:predicted small secreted protein
MEGYANLFLFALLGIGVFALLARKLRGCAVILILAVLTLFFVVPYVSFWRFVQNSEGTYKAINGNYIIIEGDTFIQKNKEGTVINKGDVTYSNIDNYSFDFNPECNCASTEVGKIVCGNITYFKE